jgi:hypothetical protein
MLQLNSGKSRYILFILIAIICLIAVILLFIFYSNRIITPTTPGPTGPTGPTGQELNKIQNYCQNTGYADLEICKYEANKNVYKLIPDEYVANFQGNILDDKAADELISQLISFTKEIGSENYFAENSIDVIEKKKLELTGESFQFANHEKSVSFDKARKEFNVVYDEQVQRAIANNQFTHRTVSTLVFDNKDYFSLTTPYLKNLVDCIGQQNVMDPDNTETISNNLVFKGNKWCNAKDGASNLLEKLLGNYFTYYRNIAEGGFVPHRIGYNEEAFIYLCNQDGQDNRALYFKNLDLASRRSLHLIIEGVIKNDISLCKQGGGEDRFYYYCKAFVESLNGPDIIMSDLENFVRDKMDISLMAEQLMAGQNLGQLNSLGYQDSLAIKDKLLSDRNFSVQKYNLLVKGKILTWKAIYNHDIKLCDSIVDDDIDKAVCINALGGAKMEDGWCYQELLKFSNNFNANFIME